MAYVLVFGIDQLMDYVILSDFNCSVPWVSTWTMGGAKQQVMRQCCVDYLIVHCLGVVCVRG